MGMSLCCPYCRPGELLPIMLRTARLVRKGCLIQALGIWKGRDICYFGSKKGQNCKQLYFLADNKSAKCSGTVVYSYIKDREFTAVKRDGKF